MDTSRNPTAAGTKMAGTSQKRVSERIVEKFIGRKFKNKKISSKLPSLQNIPSKKIEEKINFFINQTLKDTRCKKIDYYLVHDENDLIKKDAKKIFYILEKFKKKKIINKIGVSIYDSKKIEKVVEELKPDIVQLPINIFDQRAINTGWLGKMIELGVEVHARSIFMQGLLLMSPVQRPAYFHKWNELFQKWDSMVAGKNVLEACLGFIKSVHISFPARMYDCLSNCRSKF